MKPDGSRSFFGYLVAFALGVAAMGIVVLVTRHNSTVSTKFKSAESSADGAPTTDETQTREPTPKTTRRFEQRTAKRITPLPGGGATSLADATPDQETERTAFIEERNSSIRQEIIHPPRQEIILAKAAPGGRISGHVTLDGKPPAEKRLPLDPNCGALFEVPPTTKFYVVNKDKGLQDVFIVVSKGLLKQRWPTPPQPALLNFEKCFFDPYISAVRTGQSISVKNHDNVLHNLHVTSDRNPEVNYALMPKSSLDLTLKEPELFVRFKCDVHPWEFAYVSVVEHPFFAVTDEQGNFTIAGLPPGDYELEARHRKAGLLKKKVTVRADESSTANFKFQLAIEQMSPRARASEEGTGF